MINLIKMKKLKTIIDLLSLFNLFVGNDKDLLPLLDFYKPINLLNLSSVISLYFNFRKSGT